MGLDKWDGIVNIYPALPIKTVVAKRANRWVVDRAINVWGHALGVKVFNVVAVRDIYGYGPENYRDTLVITCWKHWQITKYAEESALGLTCNMSLQAYKRDTVIYSSDLKPKDAVMILTHELGHALGLTHNYIQGSLMYPRCSFCARPLKKEVRLLKKAYKLNA